VIGIGMLFPLLLPYLRSGAFTRRPALGATCVLAGGLLLRFVVIMAPQWPYIALWKL
jgi:formate-dependent nitrite reductase membrane component NrfD